MSVKVFDSETYYQKIMQLNIAHYAGEISYYIDAEIRSTERAIVGDLKIRGDIELLDVCCGSGRLSFFLAQNNFQVMGLDICPQAIETAAQKAKELRLKNLKFLVGDATALPFEDNTFDVTLCPRYSINAIPLYEKRLTTISEMVRVTKPGGLVYIESFNYFYLGRKGSLFISNLVRDFKRLFNWYICRLFNRAYLDLLPGDITYKADKVLGAPEGYAHLVNFFELRRLLKDLKSLKVKGVKLVSSREICGWRDWPILRFFRYAIWLKIEKEG